MSHPTWRPYTAWLRVSWSSTRLLSMWSDGLAFCDCGVHSVCRLMDEDKRVMEASWWERLTQGETGSWSDVRGMLSKSLVQFSVDGWGHSHSLVFDLRPNNGGDKEDIGDLIQKVLCMHCWTQFPQTCSRPVLTHASAEDSWTWTGKSGSVSFGVIASFSWILLCTGFCLCPLRVCFCSPV